MPAIGFKRVRASLRPRRSIRLRLTLLYGGLFLLSGAVLLTVTYVIVAHTTGGVVIKTSVTGSGSGKLGAIPPEQLLAWGEAQKAEQHAQMLRQLLTVSVLALAAMALISVLLGWWIAGRALRPVREMTGKARRLSEANLHERLDVAGPDDELKELGDTFDGLLARLDTAFEAQRRFVANASHELRTPLTLQRAALEIALADPYADAVQLRGVCERVLAAGSEQERLIEALLTLARGQRGLDRREPVDLADVAARAVGERAGSEGVEITHGLAPARTCGDARLLERLVTNLVDNALRHNVPGGWIAVWTGTDRGAGHERAMLRVVNSGPVVPPERIGELVQPFRRMQDRTGRRDGFGLGLSIVAAVAGAHGAHLAIEPRAEGGLEVTVAFRADQHAAGALASPIPIPSPVPFPNRPSVRSSPAEPAAAGRAAPSVR